MDRLRVRSRPRRRWGARSAQLAAVCLAIAASAPGLAAQSERSDWTARCVGRGIIEEACLASVLGTEAVIGGTGTAFSLGSEFPGSASTLGRRYETTPRVATSLRLGLTDLSYPAVGVGEASSSSWVPSIQGSAAVGVFDGFRPRPTVGGVLSVDLMAVGGWAFLPSGDGFDGAVGSFGYGLRLGLIRESFSLPGITLSLVRRHAGSLLWEGGPNVAPGQLDLDGVTTTSVRATIGREFRALGIQAGFGWDDASADGSFVPDAGVPVPFEDFDTRRTLFFGGVTATWLIVQFHGELGYAGGYDGVAGASSADFDPSAGSLVGSLTLRVLF